MMVVDSFYQVLKSEVNMQANPGALCGLLVLDLSRLLPGPYCTMILADHGARVIAIEDRRFRNEEIFPATVNRNKEHMTLNLKTDEGREIFYRLVAAADVVVEGFRPGVVQRLGVDYETIQKINPRIVYCAVTGYGQTGPLRDRAGHDVNYLAHAGVLDLIGEADRPPSIPGVQIADMAGGGLNAAVGILLALLARGKSGRGQYIDISMTDGAASLLSLQLHFQQVDGRSPRRGDSRFAHRYACYNTYETRDGRYIAIGAVENRFWQKLCDHFEVPEYSVLQYDEGRRNEILAFMRSAIRKKTLAQWEEDLADIDACWAPVKTLDDVLQAPLFRERDMVVKIEGEESETTPLFGTPIKLSDTPGGIRTAPPTFGGNTHAILSEFGYSIEEIKVLVEKGVV
jgi:crotonobetainyl-CoA:carnitine CoA-transferase CaiB-like acyl-CoA transferase